jgi:hypothetical protein
LKWVIGHLETLTTGSGDSFFGFLDEVRLYNRRLSAADVQELYLSTGHMPLAIETQPVGGTVYSNDWCTLSVKMVRVEQGLSYQWRLNGAGMLNATNTTLNFRPLRATDSGNYDVVITNSLFANSSVTSSVAALNVVGGPVNLASGLTTYYTFDETSGGTAADSSGNGYGATLYNFPGDDSQWVAGVPGLTNGAGRSGALLFNASDTVSNNYVQTDAALAFSDTNVFSFAFWAKRGSDFAPNVPRLVSPTTHWMLWQPGVGMGIFTPTASPDPVKSVWQHFVMTYSRTNYAYGIGFGSYSLYIDGVKYIDNAMAASVGGYMKPTTAAMRWMIGHNEVAGTHTDSWHGCMDDVRIYNRILNPSEAAALYQMATPQAPSFAIQPESKALFVGETLRLTPSVDGTAPIAYQWYKGISAIANATNLNYTLSGVQTGDAGSYTLVAIGQVSPPATSSVAAITVTTVASVTNGLAGYWKFDETSGGTAADSSGNGNNGTISNGSADGGQWTSGQVGGALQFRGTGLGDDYVRIPNWPKALNGTMTFSAWVKADVPSAGAFVAGGGSAVDGVGQFALNVTNTLDARGAVENKFYVRAQGRDGVVLPTNAWQHLAVVANGTSLILYRNGAQQATVAYNGTLCNPTNVLSLGALLVPDDSAVQYGTSWQGKMDEVVYWTRGLTPLEIFGVYAAGFNHRTVSDADLYTNSPPVISSQPQSETLYYGDYFWPLIVSASSPVTMTYQWRLNGSPIQGASTSTYNKGGIGVAVAFSDAGSYTVVLSNSYGSVTSAVATVAVSAPAPQLDDAMVIHLKLDEKSGSTAADSTTNLNNGNLLNYSAPDAAWTSGLLSNALKINVDDASLPNNLVQVPDAPSLSFTTESLGVSLWVKAKLGVTQTNGAGLLAKGLGGGGESYAVDFYYGGGAARGYRFFVRNSSGTQAGSGAVGSGLTGVTNGGWEHLAAIYDMTNGRTEFYLNGVLKMTGTTEGSLFQTSRPVEVGARDNDGVHTPDFFIFQGTLDDVRLYNRALTPLEVRALAYQGFPPRLSIAATNGQATVSWPLEATAVYDLQAALTLSGTWTNVPGITTNWVAVTPSSDELFYRLHRK